VLDACLAHAGDGLGLDLQSGLAGIGLNLAHFADRTGDGVLWRRAESIAESIAGRLGGADAVPETSGGANPRAGLMRGASGAALLFVRLFERSADEAWLDLAEIALRQDLRRCVLREDGGLQVNEGWRTLPYLADGSLGIGMVLEEFLEHRHVPGFAAATAAIRTAASAPFYIEPGLFRGRAGFILALSRRLPAGEAARDPVVAAHVRRLQWHAVQYEGELAFPGAELLRLSMDLATGNAGVMLALGAALHGEPVSLPFLGPPAVTAGAGDLVTTTLERR
jgi:hypothetical protein